MSQPTALANLIPRSPTALKKVVSADEDGNPIVDEIVEKSVYSPVVFSSDPALAEKERMAYKEAIVKECLFLQAAYPPNTMSEAEKQQRIAFYGILQANIEENNIPIKRLHDAILKVTATQKYFKIADIIGFDKTIILGTNKASLSRKLRRPVFEEELVVTYEIVNGRVVRLLGLAEDVQKSVEYSNRILGVWDSNTHGWVWVGTVNDPSMQDRQLEFKNSLRRFLKYPGFPGEYDVNVVKSFYEFYSAVMPPGDKMRWETFMSFDAESWLYTWNRKYNEK